MLAVKRFADIESEKLVLCQMILDNKIIPEVNTIIRKESFTHPVHAACYEYIVKKFSGGAKVDSMLFINDLKEVDMDTKIEITSATYSSSNWSVYANRVRNCYAAREIQKSFMAVIEDLTADNVFELASQSMSEVNDVVSNVTKTKILKYRDMIPAYMNKIEERYNNKNVILGTPTGLENIDELMGGGLQDELIYLGARPSIGKTALALQIANAMSVKKNVLFFELEMTENAVTERAVSNTAKLDIKSLRSGFLTMSNFQNLQTACEKLFNNDNISFAFPEKHSICDIVTTIRARVMVDHINAVFIDHIGLIKPEGHYHSTWEGVAEISHTFQQLQRELKIPIFILVQLTRDAEGKEASLANIAGSDAISQDADVIMALSRKRQKEKDELMIPATLEIQKNRNGACGVCHLTFIPRQVMFVVDNNPQEIDSSVEKNGKKFA